jgi:hypothetical protein
MLNKRAYRIGAGFIMTNKLMETEAARVTLSSTTSYIKKQKLFKPLFPAQQKRGWSSEA